MKMKNLPLKALTFIVLFLVATTSYSQVGIGTLNPDESAMLDIQSTTKGMLAPRMTAEQRIAISDPINGLLVYDTTENAFYFYKSSVWTKLDSKVRDNYKLVKSAADLSTELTAGGGSKYLLSSNILYEINGTINLAHPIDLNDAYILGLDTNEDKLVKSGGTMFVSSSGGTIKNLTLVASGGTVFNFTGSAAQSLIIRDLVIANSASVGSISGYGMVFLSVIQFIGNTEGITYSDIGNLLLSNTGWFSTNAGTYETYTGTFNFIQKQGGFMTINGSAKGMDFSSNPAVFKAVLDGVSFSGTSTVYIEAYTTGSYLGYNFNNSWTVNCPGIKLESDEVASANIYFDDTSNAVYNVAVSSNSAFNLIPNAPGNNIKAVNMLRAATANNKSKIVYEGKKTRTFQVNASVSLQAVTGYFSSGTYAFFIRKDGINLSETKTIIKVNSSTEFFNLSILGTVELDPNDDIEIYGQRLSGSNVDISVASLNLSIK